MESRGEILLVRGIDKVSLSTVEPYYCVQCGRKVISDFMQVYVTAKEGRLVEENHTILFLHKLCKQKYIEYLNKINWSYKEREWATKELIEEKLKKLEEELDSLE